MDLLTPLITGALLALFTAIQTWINKGRFDAIDRQFDQVRADMGKLQREIASVRSDLQGDIASVRSDLFQVVLRLGTEPRPQTG